MASWSVRLRGPKGAGATLSISPDDSVQRFCELAAQLLALPKSKSLTFRAGFPPRLLAYDPNERVQSVFARNDTVVVGIADSSAAPAAPTVIQGVAPRASAAGKRTASARARGSGVRLGDAADDDDDNREADSVGDDRGNSAAAGSEPRKYRRVQALQLTSKEDVAVSLVNAVSGHGTDRAAKFFRAATKTAVEYQYEMALANTRLNAALANRFEIHDVASVRRAGDESAPVEMRVRFKEGMRRWREESVAMLHGAELKAVLKYVLLSGGETGKEMLKPFNMAQCSPRVFWSIARLYSGDIARGLADLVPEEDWSYLDIRARAMSQKAIEAKANEEHWKLWKEESRAKRQLQHAADESNATTASASTNDDVIVIDDSDDGAGAATSRYKSSTPSQTRTAAVPAPVVNRAGRGGADKMAIQRALRAATARAALSRFDVAAQTAEVVSAFQQADETEQKTRVAARDRYDEDTDTDDEAVEPTMTVYCDACNKARILSADEADAADVGADTWTCAKLVDARRASGCDAVDDEVEQIAGKTIALLLQKAQIHTRKQLANATASKALKLLVTPAETANTMLKERLASMIEEARLDEVNDLMSEMVGDADLVGLLELQKLGTPADLVTTPLDLIYDAVRGDEHDDVTVERVQSWREQAKALVQQFPWLSEWRTL
ncbi:hypothetical protein PybrP1_011676 [[Pythium] brassicae (nom. inval.)]|nr:hypothetical protein PybrP1_011676 [[Pythium] brassicae (nom. inval.)]